MSYSKTHKTVFPGLGGWTYQGDVALGDPPAGGFYVDQTSMSSGAPTIELNVTDDNGIDHSDWLQDLVNTNHLILRDRACPEDSLVLELSANTPGAGFLTLVGDIRSGSGTFRVGATYDLWSITTSEDFVTGPASSTLNAVPTFSGGTGKVLQDNPDLLYASGELQLTSATSALEAKERNLAPTFAVAKGHIWVRDDIPNTLVFTDDTGADHPIFDFIVGPASSTLNAVPTFSGGTGKVLQDNPDLLYASGELQLTSATSALEAKERNLAPTFAADKGHVWVKNDDPNTAVFTDDLGNDHPLGLSNSVLLGEWKFGGALSITTLGEFDTSPTSPLTSITAIRFNAYPQTGTGQSMGTWAGLLPQEGILYFQDVTDPGGTSVTFHYTSLTFPLGGGWPQFNGAVLSTNGTVHGTNWSANNYSLQLVAVDPSLDSVILGSDPDNDVTVLSTEPIIFRDNAVNFTPFEIVSTNATVATPSLKVTKQNTSSVAFQAETTGGASGISISPTRIEPYANTTSNVDYYFVPADTTSGTYHGVDVTLSGGEHTGSLSGGRLYLDAGASTSGTDGIIVIGETNTEEIVIGSSSTPGVSITQGTDHPVAPVATKAQLWVKSDYLNPASVGDASYHVRDGQGLMMTDDTGEDINLSWLASNYKTLLGSQMAFSKVEEQGIYAGGNQRVIGDNCVSYIYDWLGNHWYISFVDATTSDALITDSADGGYTWATNSVVDTSIAAGDMAPPCTNGTQLGVAADGNFYLSTDLTAIGLPAPASPTGSPAVMNGSTGLVWSEQASLWVMCGDDSGASGRIYTSPTGTTWTNRTPAGMTDDLPVSMDIAHVGFGGYLGTERIIIVCGASRTSMWYSTNGGVSWTEDNSNVPTIGLEIIMWAPSVGTAVNINQPGIWLGIDALDNLWASTAANGLDWYDTTIQAHHIFRTEEFAGYGNNSTTTPTFYQITSGTDFLTFGGVGTSRSAALYNGAFPRFQCNIASVRARYQWGNGAIIWDRTGDGETVVGRYGPIKE